MIRRMLGAAAAATLSSVAIMPIVAAQEQCPAGQVYVDKDWGCLKKETVDEAKAICKKYEADLRECLCEEDGSVGACGD